MNTLSARRPTFNGLLKALKRGETEKGMCVLAWYNSELKACVGIKPPAIMEEHLCQVAEGSQIGKITQDEDVCVTPNAWFVIGAQVEALLERFGATDNGRLRAFCAVLNRGQCLKTDFVCKFLRRS